MSASEYPAPGEQPILTKLRQNGYKVGSLAELRNSKVRYRTAVPILVESLSKTTDPKALMELVRALAVPWARPIATGPMIDVFKSVPVDPGSPLNSLRWAVGNSLDILWDDAYYEDLVSLVLDRSYGRDREMIVLGLSRSKRAEAAAVLVELLDDRDVNGHAVKALRKRNEPSARAGLERMLDDDRTWVRKEARRALDALG